MTIELESNNHKEKSNVSPFSTLISNDRCRAPPPPTLPPELPITTPQNINTINAKWLQKVTNRSLHEIDNKKTVIVDSGASNIYLTPAAPMLNVDSTTPKINVGTAAGMPQTSIATCDLAIPNLPADFPKTGYVMPEFHQNLVGIGPMCNTGAPSRSLRTPSSSPTHTTHRS